MNIDLFDPLVPPFPLENTRVLIDGLETYTAMAAAIRRAKSSVYMLGWEFSLFSPFAPSWSERYGGNPAEVEHSLRSARPPQTYLHSPKIPAGWVSLADVLLEAASRGVCIRILTWRHAVLSVLGRVAYIGERTLESELSAFRTVGAKRGVRVRVLSTPFHLPFTSPPSQTAPFLPHIGPDGAACGTEPSIVVVVALNPRGFVSAHHEKAVIVDADHVCLNRSPRSPPPTTTTASSNTATPPTPDGEALSPNGPSVGAVAVTAASQGGVSGCRDRCQVTPVAFIGGFDIAFGRLDTPSHTPPPNPIASLRALVAHAARRRFDVLTPCTREPLKDQAALFLQSTQMRLQMARMVLMSGGGREMLSGVAHRAWVDLRNQTHSAIFSRLAAFLATPEGMSFAAAAQGAAAQLLQRTGYPPFLLQLGASVATAMASGSGGRRAIKDCDGDDDCDHSAEAPGRNDSSTSAPSAGESVDSAEESATLRKRSRRAVGGVPKEGGRIPLAVVEAPRSRLLWHDVHVCLSGHPVAVIVSHFRQRWAACFSGNPAAAAMLASPPGVSDTAAFASSASRGVEERTYPSPLRERPRLAFQRLWRMASSSVSAPTRPLAPGVAACWVCGDEGLPCAFCAVAPLSAIPPPTARGDVVERGGAGASSSVTTESGIACAPVGHPQPLIARGGTCALRRLWPLAVSPSHAQHELLRVIRSARRFLYIEHQYACLSTKVVNALLAALRAHPSLHVVIVSNAEAELAPGVFEAVLPAISRTVMRAHLDEVHAAAPERVGVYGLVSMCPYNHRPHSVYVHSKVVIADTHTLAVGSMNMDDISFERSSELLSVLYHPELAVGTLRRLACEHLGAAGPAAAAAVASGNFKELSSIWHSTAHDVRREILDRRSDFTAHVVPLAPSRLYADVRHRVSHPSGIAKHIVKHRIVPSGRSVVEALLRRPSVAHL